MKTHLKSVMTIIFSVILSLLLCCFNSCKNNMRSLLIAGVSENGSKYFSAVIEKEIAGKNEKNSQLIGKTYAVTLNGQEFTGTYFDSFISPYYSCDGDTYVCKNEDGSTLVFGINRQSKELVSYILDNYPCNTTKETGKNRDECLRIAREVLQSHFKDCVFAEKELNNSFSGDGYSFCFAMMMDDWETRATVSITVNTDGVVTEYSAITMESFGNLNSLATKVDHINKDEINSQIDERILELYKGKSCSWEVKGCYLSVIDDLGPCIEYEISVKVLDDNPANGSESDGEFYNNTVGLMMIKVL
ncbi:MAG: hypothetical protein K6G89_03320 [Clostridia bacterium]|nr:hypothetical protein [Clostridia bacterium]